MPHAQFASFCNMHNIKSVSAVNCPVILGNMAHALNNEINHPELTALLDMLSYYHEKGKEGLEVPEIEGVKDSIKALIVNLTS